MADGSCERRSQETFNRKSAEVSTVAGAARYSQNRTTMPVVKRTLL